MPIDDERHLQFFGFFSQHEPLGPMFIRNLCVDPDNYVEVRDSRDDNWGQDRDAMARGHFSGIVNHILLEDAVVQASIGPVASRKREFLTNIDLGIQTCRRLLLDALDRLEAGEIIDGAMPAVNRSVIARGALLAAGDDWRDIGAAPEQ